MRYWDDAATGRTKDGLTGTRGVSVSARWSLLRSAWSLPVVLGLLALAVRSVHLDVPAHFDELYHVLAAQGWLAEGQFRIAEGVYDRGTAFTILVAWFFAVFGDSLEVARLPSVLAGSLLVVLIFVWTRAVAGTVAAIIAALLLALAPEAIAISQFARFYAVHALLFCLGAIGVYVLLEPRRSWPWALALALGVLACFALAEHLQPITLIGLVGVGLWAALAVGLPWLASLRRRPLLFWSAIVGLAAGAGLVVTYLIASGIGAELLARYRSTALWNEAYKNAFWYYHEDLALDYPTLWPLVPVAALIALATRPRPAGFCLCVFATAFLLHSFAGPKTTRYLQYAMPFFFVLWGMALAEVLGGLRRLLTDTAGRAVSPLPRFRQPAQTALLGASVLFVLFANAATLKTVAHLAGITVPPLQPAPDWRAARPVLEPWLDGEAVVLTTRELKALYYLGRYDITISKSRLDDFGGGDFASDPRTGRPVIGTLEAVTLVMDCVPRGLVVLPEEHWRDPAQITPAIANLLEARAEQLALPPASGLRAYSWEWTGQRAPPEACADLPLRAGAVTKLPAT